MIPESKNLCQPVTVTVTVNNNHLTRRIENFAKESGSRVETKMIL